MLTIMTAPKQKQPLNKMLFSEVGMKPTLVLGFAVGNFFSF